jgi:hypothetical protein
MVDTEVVKPNFMVSYSQVDARAVKTLTAGMDKLGIDYFIDAKDIEPGQAITQRVRQGIHGCTHVLVYVSPASKNSRWVSFELGMASALDKPIICYLSHPGEETFEPLAGIKYITNRPELVKYLKRLVADESDVETMSPVERLAKAKLYYYPGGWASAIRLFGAADDAVPWSRVEVNYVNVPVPQHPELLLYRKEAIERRRRQAEQNEQIFFNGPNARLVAWRASPRDHIGAARELNFLELTIGPVGWYDYEGLNDAFREIIPAIGSERTYEALIGTAALVRDGDPSKSVLSNILDNAVTLVTTDGFIAYQERGRRVASVPGKLTSAVAENINRYLDETDLLDQTKRLHLLTEISEIDETTIAADYAPTGVPHPFAAAERGIAWELSPRLLDEDGIARLRLTGLSFDLTALHPNALYILPVPFTHDEVINFCQSEPGKEWQEGKLLFMPAYGDLPETRAVLSAPTWVPAGKASVLRALELLRHISVVRSCDVRQAVMHLLESA